MLGNFKFKLISLRFHLHDAVLEYARRSWEEKGVVELDHSLPDHYSVNKILILIDYLDEEVTVVGLELPPRLDFASQLPVGESCT